MANLYLSLKIEIGEKHESLAITREGRCQLTVTEFSFAEAMKMMVKVVLGEQMTRDVGVPTLETIRS